MDGKTLFLAGHSHLHSLGTTGAKGPSFEDQLFDGLNEEQMRSRPSGFNSLIWIFWHMTRFEDFMVNTLLRGSLEVLERGEWLSQLGIDSRHVGTGQTDEEVGDLSSRIDPAALRAYRAEVGRETRRWVAETEASELESVPDISSRIEGSPGALNERANWVRAAWEGKTGVELLASGVLGHSNIHIGEARMTRALIDGKKR